MKGDVTLKLLKYIGNAAVDVSDLTAAFLESGYGASPQKIMNKFEKRSIMRAKNKEAKSEKERFRQRFYSMLHKLKKDGLVDVAIENKKSFLRLTSDGKRRLLALKKIHANALPDNSYSECGAVNGKFTIVVFDVPEKERRKRFWLRSALRNLGFQLIQKSVWMGKVKIPEMFLDDLKESRLIEYVEIFEISKTGSLRQLA